LGGKRGSRAAGTETSTALGPVDLWGVIRAAVAYYRSSFTRLAPPALAVALVVYLATVGAFVAMGANASTLRPSASTIVVFFAEELAFQIAGSLVVALGAILLARDLAGRRISAGQGLHRLGPLWTSLLAAALYSGMFALLTLFLGQILPLAQIVLPTMMLGPPIVVHAIAVEGRILQAAVPRARELVRGETLRLLGYLFLFALAVKLVEAVLLLLVSSGLAALGVEDGVPVIVGNVVMAALMSGALVLPFTAAATFACYLDVRARTEEVDAAALEETTE
jgi:hypothetical protein